MDRINGKLRLSGDYIGNRDADIHFKFRFCDDGVYYYMVEQVGIWRLAHRGRFEIRDGITFRPGERQRQVVRMQPCAIDIEPADAYVYGELAERGLPAKNTEDYYLTAYQYDHAVNPNIKMRSYTFCIPAADGISSTDWSLEPVRN